MPTVPGEVKAPYPPSALEAGKEAVVILRVSIDETGTVREVRGVSSAGGAFARNAAEAMCKFRFSPPRNDLGQPVPVRINYTYRFVLGPAPAAPPAKP
jgi:TonB family protein